MVLLLTGAVVVKASPFVEHFMFFLAVWKTWRVAPFVRAVKHYRGMKMMGMALKSSARELMFLAIVLFIGALLFGYALYLSELWSLETQCVGAPDAMWWGVITMTTVGYGDVVPTTWPGKVIGFVCAISGILTVALPVPIVATNFYRIHENVSIADLKSELTKEHQKEEEEKAQKLEEKAQIRQASCKSIGDVKQ